MGVHGKAWTNRTFSPPSRSKQDLRADQQRRTLSTKSRQEHCIALAWRKVARPLVPPRRRQPREGTSCGRRSSVTAVIRELGPAISNHAR